MHLTYSAHAAFCLAIVLAGLPGPGAFGDDPGSVDKGEEPEREIPRVSLDVARDRAALMHDVYVATLDAMHHRYFHGDRTVVPARAMEDVFRDLAFERQIESKWISASFSPMSIDHEPETEFEKQAARKLAKGEESVEVVEAGYYRRAGSISLNQGCVSCHSGLFASASTTPKFAGLIISIPVSSEAALPAATPAQ